MVGSDEEDAASNVAAVGSDKEDVTEREKEMVENTDQVCCNSPYTSPRTHDSGDGDVMGE